MGKKEFWSKILHNYRAELSSNCKDRLIEDTRRVSIIHQLNEVGFDNVSVLSTHIFQYDSLKNLQFVQKFR